MEFKKLIGQNVLAIVPFLNPDNLTEMKILGVDTGGVWVDSESFNSMLKSILGPTLEEGSIAPAVFVPFHEIRAAFVKREHTNPSVSMI